MARLLRVAAAMYFLAQVWMYRYRVPGRAAEWESPHGNLLVEMGFVDQQGEVLWYGQT